MGSVCGNGLTISMYLNQPNHVACSDVKRKPSSGLVFALLPVNAAIAIVEKPMVIPS